MRKTVYSLAAVALIAPVVAGAQADADNKVAGGGTVPAGWQMRVDPKAGSGTEPKMAAMGAGFHVTSGARAIYWRPSDAAKGNYTVEATLAQTTAPAHPEAYGIFFAGKELQSPNQQYMYFLVRQDGKYMISHRADDNTIHSIVPWTDNAAIRKADAQGKASNTLAVDVGAEQIRFLVNGTAVHSIPRSQVQGPGHINALDGFAGLRVNHNLDVHIDGLKVAQK